MVLLVLETWRAWQLRLKNWGICGWRQPQLFLHQPGAHCSDLFSQLCPVFFLSTIPWQKPLSEPHIFGVSNLRFSSISANGWKNSRERESTVRLKERRAALQNVGKRFNLFGILLQDSDTEMPFHQFHSHNFHPS